MQKFILLCVTCLLLASCESSHQTLPVHTIVPTVASGSSDTIITDKEIDDLIDTVMQGFDVTKN